MERESVKLPVVLGYRVYPAGGAENFIKQSLSELLPHVEAAVITISSKPWNGPDHPKDNSLRLIGECIYTTPIHVKIDHWKTEEDQGNWILNKVRNDYPDSYLLLIDSDEIITLDTLKKGLENIGDHDALHFYHRCYWKTIHYRLIPDFEVSAIGLISPEATAKIESYRHLAGRKYKFLSPEDGFCHHYAYVRTDDQMKQKLSSFSHSAEIIPGWFENKWKEWDKDHNTQYLHPVASDKWPNVHYVDDVPEILKRMPPANVFL